MYPHSAPPSLLQIGRHPPYKVSKSRRYWTDLSRDERYARLLVSQYLILEGSTLQDIDGLDLPLPAPGAAGPLAGLKRYEDALDALVCAWVATLYSDGRATAFNAGYGSAAIWVVAGMLGPH